MIEYGEGNIFKTDAQALVIPVNTEGVCGKGLALQFRNRFPEEYKSYRRACISDLVKVGQMYCIPMALTKDQRLQYLICFPTKMYWRYPSRIEFIESGMESLVSLMHFHEMKSIAIPALGCGAGELKWVDIKPKLESYVKDLEARVVLYPPAKFA